MAKSALGRGLGKLLNDQDTPANRVVAGAKVYVSPGVQTIIEGSDASLESPAIDRWPTIRTALVIADMVLLTLCGLVVWRSAGDMTILEALACSAAVALGAVLACACLALDGAGTARPRSRRPRGNPQITA